MIFTGHQSFNKFTDISKEIFSVAIIQSVPKILHENYCSFYLFFLLLKNITKLAFLESQTFLINI
jgi:hypothetical protein